MQVVDEGGTLRDVRVGEREEKGRKAMNDLSGLWTEMPLEVENGEHVRRPSEAAERPVVISSPNP